MTMTMTTKASVVRLRGGSGLHKVETRTQTRVVHGIVGTVAWWYEGRGWCSIGGRCVEVMKPRGWDSWVYFDGPAR